MPDGKVLEFEPTLTPQCQTFEPMDEVAVGYRPRPGTLGTLEPVGGAAALVVGAWPAPLASRRPQSARAPAKSPRTSRSEARCTRAAASAGAALSTVPSKASAAGKSCRY